MPFTSAYLVLEPDGRKIHYVESHTFAINRLTCVVAIHGLGGSSSFWLPAFQAGGLGSSRRLIAYDMDGHGLSDFSGRKDLSIQDYVEDLKLVLDGLGLKKVILLGHSMQGIVTSVFTQTYPERVEKLILLHPVRNLGPAGIVGMQNRASTVLTSLSAFSEVANTVSTSAVSKLVASTNPAAVTFIRHLVLATKPEAYAAACLALAGAPKVEGKALRCDVCFIGGAEDYLAGPELVKAWAGEIPEGRGSVTILNDVGHWGAVESPVQVGEALRTALSPRSYFLLLGTFRSPLLFTLSFDLVSGKLQLLHTNSTVGGHSWLDLSPDSTTLYATGWTTPPSVSSYSIAPPTSEVPYPAVQLQQQVPSRHLSGYVCSNSKAMYSACGPQVDVFLLDEATGALTQEAVQSFSLMSEEDQHKGNSQMDFGGLRHGGHSCDLSPDGTKLYVADIGRNCVWLYHVDKETGRLKEASKNIAKRPHDGPRHTWPHPNGKVVYSLQEHSSYVDVLQLSGDGEHLEWVQGVDILPAGHDCSMYWADEVRLSPSADVLFGSTRGLEPKTRGFISSWTLLPSGLVASPEADVLHRFETRTSGGWANAIAVCPTTGTNGEVYLTLTDSEEGFIQMLEFTAMDGFKVLDEVGLGSDSDHVGASVAVWL